MTGSHLEEEQNALVLVLRAPLAHAQRVVDAVGEVLEDGVDFCGAEPYAAGIQNSVTEGGEIE